MWRVRSSLGQLLDRALIERAGLGGTVGPSVDVGARRGARAREAGAKNADYIVANDVSAEGEGFAAARNRVVIFGRDGTRTEAAGTKLAVAHAIWDCVVGVPSNWAECERRR